jgi:RNA polymerase sigma factor (sigma-70 family)
VQITDIPAGELVRRAREGADQDAWAALVERFGGMVWAVTRSYGLSTPDASDVTQIVWLRLVENLDRIEEPDAIAGWLAVTARRECLHHLRHRNQPTPAADAHTIPSPAPPPDRIAAERDRLSRVAAALLRLPGRCRDLLRLLAGPGVTYAEVAAALDIPIGSIGPRRARCLASLRRLLGDHDR